jgi:hypothetical protein
MARVCFAVNKSAVWFPFSFISFHLVTPRASRGVLVAAPADIETISALDGSIGLGREESLVVIGVCSSL